MWEYICSRCGYRVEQEDIIATACPECGGNSWLSHLLTEDSQNRLSVNNVTHSTKRTESTRKAVTKRSYKKPCAGRPQLELPMAKILEMQAQGMASRDIAKQLGVSHMTVCRALKKARQEKTVIASFNRSSPLCKGTEVVRLGISYSGRA